MHKGYSKLLEGLQELQDDSRKNLDLASDPAVLQAMNEKQRALISDAKKAINMKGLEPSEMQTKIDAIMAKHGINNKYGA